MILEKKKLRTGAIEACTEETCKSESKDKCFMPEQEITILGSD